MTWREAAKTVRLPISKFDHRMLKFSSNVKKVDIGRSILMDGEESIICQTLISMEDLGKHMELIEVSHIVQELLKTFPMARKN